MSYARTHQPRLPAADELSSPAPLPIQIVEWRAFQKNTLLGFATVRLGRNLLIHDLTIHRGHGRQWVAMPSKPRLNRDGTQMVGENGKLAWTPVVAWDSRESADRFSHAVLAALVARHPDALADDGR